MVDVTTVSAGQNAADQQESADDPDNRPDQPTFFARMVRARMSSGLATGMSQVTLIVLLTMDVNPTVASAAAFVAGALPHSFVARRWAGKRKGKPHCEPGVRPY